MKQKILQLFFAVATSATVVAAKVTEPTVVARVSFKAKMVFGAVAKDNTFVLLADDMLYAFSSKGAKLWKVKSPWCKFPKLPKGCRTIIETFNRPRLVAVTGGVAVLNCRNWKLVLETFNLKGRRTGSVQPVAFNMRLRTGILQLGRAGDSIVFGYRLSIKQTRDKPDKGVLVFDSSLKKRYHHDAWGDRICCMRDGSVYSPTVRWGKDIKWTRFTKDGKKHPLPKSVSSYTWVAQPGNDNEVILWGGRENSVGERPDGNDDSIGLRKIWYPSQPKAQVIHEFWKGWQGSVIACGQGRYLIKAWPNSQQQFICVNSYGKKLWEHKPTLYRHFWVPLPLCDKDGNLYLMDTGKGKKTNECRVLLRCLSPSGQTTWELTVNHTEKQPQFGILAKTESHLLIIRRDRSNNVELIFIALPKLIKTAQ